MLTKLELLADNGAIFTQIFFILECHTMKKLLAISLINHRFDTILLAGVNLFRILLRVKRKGKKKKNETREDTRVREIDGK